MRRTPRMRLSPWAGRSPLDHAGFAPRTSTLSGIRIAERPVAENLNGLDSPRRILQMLAGENEAAALARPIRQGLTLLRYSTDVLVGAEAIDSLGYVR